VTFTSATPGVCSVSGSTVSFAAAGTCVIDANQAGDTSYAAAAQVSQTLVVRFAGAHVTLTKSPSRSFGAAPFSVTYTYKVANDGSDTLYHLSVSDDSCAPVTYQRGDSNGDQLIEPGETFVFACTQTLSAPGPHTDTATALAYDTQTGLAVNSNAAQATVTVTSGVDGGHMTLSKQATPSSGPAPLQVSYGYTLINDGSDPLFGVKLSDDSCAPVSYVSGDNVDVGVLDPGEAWTYSCAQTLSAPGPHTNTASATATDTQTGLAVNSNTATATATVTVVGPPVSTGPHITLTKTAGSASGTAPLNETFTFTVTNDGTETLFHLAVSDDSCSPVAYQGGDSNGDQLIQPGEVWRFTCSQVLTAPGPHTDTASASGFSTATGAAISSNTASATVTVSAAT